MKCHITDYFIDNCRPDCPKLVVASVQQKLRELLNRQNLGPPMLDHLTVDEVVTIILSCQGGFIKGNTVINIKEAENAIFKNIELMVDGLDDELKNLLGKEKLGTPLKSKMRSDIDDVLRYISEKIFDQGEKGYTLTEEDFKFETPKESPNKRFDNCAKKIYLKFSEERKEKREYVSTSNTSISFRASEGAIARYSDKGRRIGVGGRVKGNFGVLWKGWNANRNTGKQEEDFVSNPMKQIDDIPGVELTSGINQA